MDGVITGVLSVAGVAALFTGAVTTFVRGLGVFGLAGNFCLVRDADLLLRSVVDFSAVDFSAALVRELDFGRPTLSFFAIALLSTLFFPSLSPPPAPPPLLPPGHPARSRSPRASRSRLAPLCPRPLLSQKLLLDRHRIVWRWSWFTSGCRWRRWSCPRWSRGSRGRTCRS